MRRKKWQSSTSSTPQYNFLTPRISKTQDITLLFVM